MCDENKICAKSLYFLFDKLTREEKWEIAKETLISNVNIRGNVEIVNAKCSLRKEEIVYSSRGRH